MNIAVIGTGYVGLVTGTCLAETGNKVTCVDIDENKVAMMNNGEIPIYEPNLNNYFQRNIKQNRLFFTSDLNTAVNDSEIIFLALPTPPGEDGSADLSYVLGVANQLGKIIEDYKSKAIIVKCKLGGRSAKAQMQLKLMGFKQVINLAGGITHYKGEVI